MPTDDTQSVPTELWVFGVGSHHGDDCFGWEVVDALRGQVPARVGLRSVSSPLDILHAISPSASCRVLLVDACDTGGPAGQLVELSGDRLVDELPATHSTHAISIPDLVRLARNLQLPIVDWYFLGFETKSCQMGTHLSPFAQKAVGKATQRIGDFIARTISRTMD